MELKVTGIGDSLAIILTKELLEMLHVEEGDTLSVLQTPAGIELTPLDQKIQRQMDVAERVMRENRNLLHKLAQ